MVDSQERSREKVAQKRGSPDVPSERGALAAERETISATDPNPMGTPGRGGLTGEDVARPRDHAAASWAEKVVAGFTGTDSSGSQGGRARYGLAPDDLTDAEEASKPE